MSIFKFVTNFCVFQTEAEKRQLADPFGNAKSYILKKIRKVFRFRGNFFV